MPSALLWAYSAEKLFLYSRLSRPRRLSGQSPSICYRRPLACLKAPLGLSLLRNRRAAPNAFSPDGAVPVSCIYSGRTAGSFSEDRPLGWDPVARRAIGRAMEWPATTATAASGGNREPLLGPRPARCERQRSRCWVPQPVFVSEEKAPCWPAIAEVRDYLQSFVRCRRRSADCSRRYRHPHPAPRPQNTGPAPFCSAWFWGPPPAPTRRRW